MKNRKILIIMFLFACLFILISCSSRNQNNSPELNAIFAEAGLRLLADRVATRDFSLPLVRSPQAAAAEVSAAPPLLSRGPESISLESLKGNIVLLNFWATWCPPCRAEKPSMQALFDRYSDKGFVVLAVNVMESESIAAEFKESFGLTFPSVLDLDGRVSSNYGVQALPTSFLVDREGFIIMRLVGSTDWDRPEIHRVIEALLE